VWVEGLGIGSHYKSNAKYVNKNQYHNTIIGRAVKHNTSNIVCNGPFLTSITHLNIGQVDTGVGFQHWFCGFESFFYSNILFPLFILF